MNTFSAPDFFTKITKIKSNDTTFVTFCITFEIKVSTRGSVCMEPFNSCYKQPTTIILSDTRARVSYCYAGNLLEDE